MKRIRVSLYLCCLFLLLCPLSLAAPETSPLTVRDGAIRDASGRQVFLWGINLGEKSSAAGHRSWHGPEDFANLRRWGMNAVRLLIFWSAVEPEPGRYDEAYLQSVDERIGWARDAGLYVILDMHQDLYSEAVPGGNGAPAWATLEDGLPHFTVGNIWSTAYYVSPKVHRVFDNFWNNAPGPDGMGIQEHFAQAWRHVAARYADTPTVAGFDLMNEPFPGSMIDEALNGLLVALPEILEGVPLPGNPAELVASVKDNPMPPWLLEALDKPERHRAAAAALEPVVRRFEEERLMAMYRRVHGAIREVNTTGILFLEPCVLANVGVPSAIEALRMPDGTVDPQQAYMPHAYDLVTDTAWVDRPSTNRLTLIIEQKSRDAKRLGLPLLIGEWGAYYGSSNTRRAARIMRGLLDQHTAGAFYWDYHRDIEQAAYFEELSRPAPLRLAGEEAAFGFQPETGLFTCRWLAGPGEGESLFALPASWDEAQLQVRVEPAELAARIETDTHDAATRHIVVSPAAVSTTAVLTVSAPTGEVQR